MVDHGADHLMERTYSTDGWSGSDNYIKSTAPMTHCGRMFEAKYESEKPVELNHIEKRLAAIA